MEGRLHLTYDFRAKPYDFHAKAVALYGLYPM